MDNLIPSSSKRKPETSANNVFRYKENDDKETRIKSLQVTGDTRRHTRQSANRTWKCSRITSAPIVVAFQLRVSSSSSFSFSHRSSSDASLEKSNSSSHCCSC